MEDGIPFNSLKILAARKQAAITHHPYSFTRPFEFDFCDTFVTRSFCDVGWFSVALLPLFNLKELIVNLHRTNINLRRTREKLFKNFRIISNLSYVVRARPNCVVEEGSDL